MKYCLQEEASGSNAGNQIGLFVIFYSIHFAIILIIYTKPVDRSGIIKYFENILCIFEKMCRVKVFYSLYKKKCIRGGSIHLTSGGVFKIRSRPT